MFAPENDVAGVPYRVQMCARAISSLITSASAKSSLVKTSFSHKGKFVNAKWNKNTKKINKLTGTFVAGL